MRLRGGGVEAPPPARTVAANGVEVRSTLLLPLLLERFDPEQPITVLDVGFGVTETLEFFADYTCRVHFAGMLDHPGFDDLPEEDQDAYLDGIFAELCDFPDGTRFDVCLLWDFLNYLPPAGLRALSRALAPYLHRQTHAHGFGAFKATAPAMAKASPWTALQYGVYAADKLVVKPRPGGKAPGHSHSRAALADALDCFEIVRGTLLQEGTMELLLQAR